MVRRVMIGLGLLAAFGVAELVLLWHIAQWAGLGVTLLLVVLASVIGFRVSKAQGLGVWRRWISSEHDGGFQEEGLIDGLLVLAGGFLLVLPGVMSDVLGLALLLPPLRRRLAERIRLRAAGWVQAGQVQVLHTSFADPPFAEHAARPAPIPRDDREIIDVEGILVEERPERLLGP